MSRGAVLGCSVQGGEHPAAHAFDGDPRTFWVADRPGGTCPGEWLAFDLGAERRVSGVEIVSGGFDGARHVAEFQLAFSLARPAGATCDAEWRQAAREKCDGAQLRTVFGGVAARYWRVLVVGAKQAGQPAAIARIALRIARDAPLLVRQRSLQVDEDEL